MQLDLWKSANASTPRWAEHHNDAMTDPISREVERVIVDAESKLINIPDSEIRRLFIKQLVARRDDRQFLTLEQLAEELAIEVRTIREWRAKNRGGPVGHKIGRFLRYRRSDVEAWLRECRFNAGGASPSSSELE